MWDQGGDPVVWGLERLLLYGLETPEVWAPAASNACQPFLPLLGAVWPRPRLLPAFGAVWGVGIGAEHGGRRGCRRRS